MSMYKKLSKIQNEIKVDKTRKADGYNYRSLEDILTALKPILLANKVVLLLTEDVFENKIIAKATLRCLETDEETIDFKGHSEVDYENQKFKGQAWGECSSYARKYALQSMLLLEDSRDLDSLTKEKPVQEFDEEIKKAVEAIKTIEELKEYSETIDLTNKLNKSLIVKRKLEIENDK